jgi:GxxExxY protein
MEFDKLSNRIINSAIKVHKKLGPGFLESIYQKALIIQLQKDGLSVEVEKEIRIYYEAEEVGIHRLDIVVENEIIVELKSVKEFNDNHIAQVLSYLKATGLNLGLLLNFAKSTLEIKRIIN